MNYYAVRYQTKTGRMHTQVCHGLKKATEVYDQKNKNFMRHGLQMLCGPEKITATKLQSPWALLLTKIINK